MTRPRVAMVVVLAVALASAVVGCEIEVPLVEAAPDAGGSGWGDGGFTGDGFGSGSADPDAGFGAGSDGSAGSGAGSDGSSGSGAGSGADGAI